MPEGSSPFVSWRMLGGGPEFDFNGVRLSPWMWEPGRAPWVKISRAEEEASRSAAQVVQAEPESEPSGSATTESIGRGGSGGE